jgi:hypothetical protein
MSTITTEQQQAIAAKLSNMTLRSGLGNEESACSIAAINLALTGKLTDDIPPCMSEVIGTWIIKIQDAMPFDIRNSVRWKELLPRAAGTGCEKESQRHAILCDWMWGVVLPTFQPIADKYGFGANWTHMTNERTSKAANEAARHAGEVRIDADEAVLHLQTLYKAGKADEMAARRMSYEAGKAMVAALQASATWHAEVAVTVGVDDAIWYRFDPCMWLARLINVK